MTTPTEDARAALAEYDASETQHDAVLVVPEIVAALRALIEPPTADEREALKVALTEGYWKRTGYRVTWENIGPLMDAILAAGFARRQVSHPEPVTDAEGEAVRTAPGPYTVADHEQYARILEAARAVRLPVPEEGS